MGSLAFTFFSMPCLLVFCLSFCLFVCLFVFTHRIYSFRLKKKLEHGWKALVHDGVRRHLLVQCLLPSRFIKVFLLLFLCVWLCDWCDCACVWGGGGGGDAGASTGTSVTVAVAVEVVSRCISFSYPLIFPFTFPSISPGYSVSAQARILLKEIPRLLCQPGV